MLKRINYPNEDEKALATLFRIANSIFLKTKKKTLCVVTTRWFAQTWLHFENLNIFGGLYKASRRSMMELSLQK